MNASHGTSSTHRLVAFTTPENYAVRLSPLIRLKDWTPLWCPTVAVEPTTHTKSSLIHYISPPNPPINQFSALAFTSRTGISAFSDALSDLKSPPLSPSGDEFTICALGNDADVIDNSFINRICNNRDRIKVLIPEIASPSGLVESLPVGGGRRVLCPVPVVVGLEEPPVVPNFIRELNLKGWVAARVDAYETRWMGAECAAAMVQRDGGCCKNTKETVINGPVGSVLINRNRSGIVSPSSRKVDAVVFTSTGEVEGMLKSLRAMGLDWGAVVERNPGVVVVAHGPVTAAGAESLGVGVDVVSKKFGSFDGVVDALARLWNN